ncbi:MAG: hypothetical protein WB791_07315 [Waddliaceae bacterium]
MKLENRHCNITDGQIRKIIETHAHSLNTENAAVLKIAKQIFYPGSLPSVTGTSNNGLGAAPRRIDLDKGDELPAQAAELIARNPHLTAEELVVCLRRMCNLEVKAQELLRLLEQQSSPDTTISSVPERDPFLDTGYTGPNGSKRVDFRQGRDFDQVFEMTRNPRHQHRDFSTYSYQHPRSKTTALYLFPVNDRNGSFALDDSLKYRLLAMSRDHSVKLVYVQNVQEMQEVMNQYNKGEIQHLVIGGHGTQHSLQFGDPVRSNDHQLSVHTDFKGNNPFSALAPNATVFLDSCLTGGKIGNKMNLSEWVSIYAPGRHVYAPKISFTAHDIVVDDFRHWNARIVKNGANGEDQMNVYIH